MKKYEKDEKGCFKLRKNKKLCLKLKKCVCKVDKGAKS